MPLPQHLWIALSQHIPGQSSQGVSRRQHSARSPRPRPHVSLGHGSIEVIEHIGEHQVHVDAIGRAELVAVQPQGLDGPVPPTAPLPRRGPPAPRLEAELDVVAGMLGPAGAQQQGLLSPRWILALLQRSAAPRAADARLHRVPGRHCRGGIWSGPPLGTAPRRPWLARARVRKPDRRARRRCPPGSSGLLEGGVDGHGLPARVGASLLQLLSELVQLSVLGLAAPRVSLMRSEAPLPFRPQRSKPWTPGSRPSTESRASSRRRS